ncbi:hypothetical protein H8N03_13165 [Ramlibacter sp. USB13]|uniref:DUF2946 domain-containing protein n=1 Tax=Ramlibacter cellulosilyticus TaxID=2764187 RepID=A0A923MSP1_9BURK|nr:hypothetical protein [Ramlibacter cellulosilyticus]MBC5783899.1 hypothetical protein [Ramlibacter cellulosilyticus]
MSALRHARRLACFVLAWFALWLGATLAAPLVGDAGLQLVCAGGSFKLVSGDDGAPAKLSGHLGQCPACVTGAAPPPPAFALRLPPAPAHEAPEAILAHGFVRNAAAPPAARGPPRLS